MDANKLDKLKGIKYTIPETCQFCEHSFIPNHNYNLCVCEYHTYTHSKHMGGEKTDGQYLSICRQGSCKDFKLCEHSLSELGAFEEFLRRRIYTS